ncbi:MAG: sigma-54-dependent Fis family transcriptional regulator [Deltaproteobacteria bacterium]|nr:sigma-54-dependent Fis family transcriptional regulator [Deltaproteobacteria bacterium]
MGSVLVLEASEALRQQLLLGLRDHGLAAQAVGGMADALPLLDAAKGKGKGKTDVVDVVILGPGGGTLEDILRGDSATEIIVLVDEAETGLRALRVGAVDFAYWPSGASGAGDLALAVRKLQAKRAFSAIAARDNNVEPSPAGALGSGSPHAVRSGASAGRRPSSPSAGAPVLIGASPQIAAVHALIGRLAGVRTSVLIGGESGSGKELVAQALHAQSPWHAGPFVAVNCGAIPSGLIESELFGHARGAFTDAIRDKQGLFQAAHNGTLFLDEIADLPLALQSKLLRAVQDGVIRRVGDSDDMRVVVRVVAATARDLTVEVAARQFREDLYYRLAGLTIQLPPLRDRREDIPLLAMHFLARARARLGVAVTDIDAEAMRLLTGYRWPGNVRELENTIERAAVLCSHDRIDVASLPERMVPDRGSGVGTAAGSDSRSRTAPDALPSQAAATDNLSIKHAARRSEEDLIRRALRVTGGNRTHAATLLEISHRALLYKIKEYGIVVASGRDAAAVRGEKAAGKD